MSAKTQQQLYAEAMAAFLDAHEMHKARPKPGTPGWERWEELTRAAVNANSAYIRSLPMPKTSNSQ